MNIKPSDTIAGLPSLKMRDLLQACRHLYSQSNLDFKAFKNILRGLEITAPANVLFRNMISEGLIEPLTDGKGSSSNIVGDSTTGRWQTTRKGTQISVAKATQPISRITALKTLKNFLERAEAVRRSPKYILFVEKAILCGSFLMKEKEKLGDLDIAFHLTPKFKKGKEWSKALNGKILEARCQGMSFMASLGWPEKEVILFLKKHQRALHLISTLDGMENEPHIPIIKNGKSTANARKLADIKKDMTQGDT